MTPNERVKILRILSGFTQQSLAEITGLSRASILSWEKDRSPACSSAKAIAFRLGVSREYLLHGMNSPLSALWKITPPAHPKHLPMMACDLSKGLPALFSELGITFVVEGADHSGTRFILCGNDSTCEDWKMNYVISYEESIRDIVLTAVQCAKAAVLEMRSPGFYEGAEAFVLDTAECLSRIHGRPADCSLLLAKFGESVEDATLAGLLKQLDKLLQSQKAAFGENERGILSTFIGKEIAKRSRLKDAAVTAG